MRLLALGLAAALLAGCGDRSALSGASPSPTSSVAPSPRFTPVPTPSPSPAPTHLPGSAVRLNVNGVDVAPGSPVELALTGVTTLVITFPVAIDRASVEIFLPRSATLTWRDDRTVSLAIPETEGNPGFKIGQATSQDGATVIDFVSVALNRPPGVVVSTFTVAELLAGGSAPKAGAPRLALGNRSQALPSADGKKLLSFLQADPPLGPALRIFDIATRAAIQIPAPGAGIVVGGWIGNDRIVLVGDRVWVMPVDGSAARVVADLSALGAPNAVAISPSGASIAVGSRDKLAVVNVATGLMRALAGHQDECSQTGPLSRLAWSQDERRIAVVECAGSAPAQVRTRIVDVAGDRTVAIVDGGMFGIRALLTGDVAVQRESSEQGEGARWLWVVFSFDGGEKARHLARAPSLSPDGHYLLDITCCAGEGFTLRDLLAAGQPERNFGGSALWLSDGRLLVLTR